MKIKLLQVLGGRRKKVRKFALQIDDMSENDVSRFLDNVTHELQGLIHETFNQTDLVGFELYSNVAEEEGRTPLYVPFRAYSLLDSAILTQLIDQQTQSDRQFWDLNKSLRINVSVLQL